MVSILVAVTRYTWLLQKSFIPCNRRLKNVSISKKLKLKDFQFCKFQFQLGLFRLHTLDDCNSVQTVTEPTRGENILDLFLTSNHTLVKMWPFTQVFHTMTWFIRRSLLNQMKLVSPHQVLTLI